MRVWVEGLLGSPCQGWHLGLLMQVKPGMHELTGQWLVSQVRASRHAQHQVASASSR